MKKLFYSFAMLIALVGCSDGGDDPVVEPTTGDDAIPAAGITVESPEGLSFAWEEGSTISLFRSKTNEKFVYNSASNEFVKTDKLEKNEPMDANYGVTPYKGTTRVANGEVKMEFPSRQTYVANGVCFAENPMVGVSASASITDMQFKNLGGYAIVKVYGTAVIKSIAIEGMNGETLAGTAMVAAEADADPTFSISALPSKQVAVTAAEPVELGLTAEEATPFYLMVPPTTFEAGFTVTLTDSYGNVRKKNFKVDEENPAVSIARNEVVEIATIELAEKLPTQTILDVVFNEDGTATDEGIYGLDVQLMGEPTNTYVYKHKDFKKNIARFHNVRINNDITRHSYYKVDYSGEDETSVAIRETIADGFALEVVTLASCANWDWWLSPVATDAFRFLLKGGAANYEWCYTYNNDGGWFANGPKINATYDFNKYHHTVYMYDADNMQIQVWHNGTLLGMTENIAEFNPGNLLTIGGYGNVNDELFMQWNGEVAMVKMYDQVLEPAEIVEKFKDLKMPEGGSLAPAATYSEPLIDIKWNADKTATNVGTQTDLEVTAVLDDNTVVKNVDGFGYVADFNAMPNNNWNPTGFYQIDYSANDAFKGKMQDGFTLEYLCVADHNPGDFYSRPVATDTFGVHLRCDPGAPSHYWQMWFNGNNSVWHSMGNTSGIGYRDVFVVETGKVMTSFVHVVIVYNPQTKMYFSYIDGHGNQGWGGVGEFNVGSYLGIPGMPGNPSGMQHGWPGKVAMVRMYDEPFNVDQILTRYNELKPAIEKLNPTIGQ